MGALESKNKNAPDLGAFLSQLEAEAAIVRLQIRDFEAQSRQYARDGNREAARQRYTLSVLKTKEQGQLLRTIVAVQTQTSAIQTNRLNTEAMRMLNSSVRTLHASQLSHEHVDAAVDQMHAMVDHGEITSEHLNEGGDHASHGVDDAAFERFLSGNKEPPHPPPAAGSEMENVAGLLKELGVAGGELPNGQPPGYMPEVVQETAMNQNHVHNVHNVF
jgi:hypothetical protein